ncbi:MAG: hypothetical protein A49_06690 [Methyloceanibacter sp.]|nr:MAG: hypothetical protein A49_06690 [Methyloceanibacter sp.]
MTNTSNAFEFPSQKFPLGQVVVTRNVTVELSPIDVLNALARHARGDWGNLSEQDRAENELALKNGYRLFSSYKKAKGITFWIITEADRSATTVLLPIEY